MQSLRTLLSMTCWFQVVLRPKVKGANAMVGFPKYIYWGVYVEPEEWKPQLSDSMTFRCVERKPMTTPFSRDLPAVSDRTNSSHNRLHGNHSWCLGFELDRKWSWTSSSSSYYILFYIILVIYIYIYIYIYIHIDLYILLLCFFFLWNIVVNRLSNYVTSCVTMVTQLVTQRAEVYMRLWGIWKNSSN